MSAPSPSRRSEPTLLVPSLLCVAFVSAAIGSLGAPLITSVATTFKVSLAAAQWTLTITLFAGAIAAPLLGRLGTGPHRRGTILATLGVVVTGSVLTVAPLPFAWLLVGRGAQGVGLGLTALTMGVGKRPGEAVELGDHEGVAGPAGRQPGPPRTARGVVARESSCATCRGTARIIV